MKTELNRDGNLFGAITYWQRAFLNFKDKKGKEKFSID